MSKLIRLIAACALVLAACGDSDGTGTSMNAPDSTATSSNSAPTTTVTAAPARTCLDSASTPYRSRFTETAEGYQSQVLREIEGDRAQWILTYPVTDALGSGRVQAQVIRGEEVWDLNADNTWESFPVVPLRWPLLVWVNGYVTGTGVAANLVAGERDVVADIPVTIYRGGVAEMTAAFPGKMNGREFDEAATSYTYWVDDCGDLLKAEVTIELGGEERALAEDIDLPTTYRYDYVVYDVGAQFSIEPPAPDYLPEIPPPPAG